MNGKDATVPLQMLRLPLSPFVWPSASLSFFIVIFCFDSIFYHLFFCETHTENVEGHDIKPNFTSKTLNQSTPLNIENGVLLLFFFNEKMEERLVDIGFLLFVSPVSRLYK